MLRSTSRKLMLVAGIALCAVFGFVAGKALASASSAGAAAGYVSAQTDAPTPSGSSGIIGSLAQNPAATEPADPTDNPADNSADTPDAAETDLSGTVAQIDAAHSNLTLATSQGNVPIVVGAQTDFGDSLSSLADLHPGMALDVSVQQANGQLNADSIDLADPTADASND